MKSGRLNAGLKQQPPRVEDLPYREFKLFHLSVLWRMGVARTNGFEHFDIGAHADALKAMIRDSDPGAPEVYPFGATALLDDSGAVVFDLIGAARCRKLGKLSLATVTFGGCCWVYMLTSNISDIPATLRSTLFRGDGTLPIESVHYQQSAAIAPHLKARIQR